MQRVCFLIFLALLCLPLGGAAWGQNQKKMTHEEEVVRTAYGKLSFAVRTAMLWDAAIHNGQNGALEDGLALTKKMNEHIRFDLSGFTVGRVSDIAKQPWSSFTEGPSGLIEARCQEMPVGFTNPQGHYSYNISSSSAAWEDTETQNVTIVDPPSDNQPAPLIPTVEQALASWDAHAKGWTRYAAYSVVAAMRGRSVSYRAFFLFKGNGKNETVFVVDQTAPGAAWSCLDQPLYPSALVDTPYRELPYVQAWLVANEVSGCKKMNTPESCCDQVNWQCGIAAEDVQRSMAKIIDEREREWFLAGVKYVARKEGKQ